MCSINGIYNHSKLKNPYSQIQAMNIKSSHRGPDNSDIYQDPDVILGHNRLSIIDLSKLANQPFISNDKEIVLVFNGEIYNYLELKKKLVNYSFRTSSDTEVLIAAYLEWNLDFVNHLDGMFSFALWDKRTRLFMLGRDKLGIKPLYYSDKNNSIAFSSEIRSLLECELVNRKLNISALHDYLQYSTVHAPNTLVKDVKMLLPGNILIIKDDEYRTYKYWELGSNLNKIEFDKDLANSKIKELFSKAVNKRTMSDVPFGAFLSGGIDSSAIVASASKTCNKQINTFTVTFDNSDYNEAKYAKIIGDKYNTNHTEINLNPEDLLKELPDFLAAVDHPSADGPNTFVVSKAVKKSGVKMVLSGLGGDEIFAGYDIFKRAYNLLDKKWLFSFPPGLRSNLGSLMKLISPTTSVEKIAETINQKRLELPYYYHISRRQLSNKTIAKLLPNYNKQLAFPLEFALDQFENSNIKKLPFLSKVSFLEINTYLQNTLLRDTDQMSMANSLEVRVPFLDIELLEYVISVSDKLKYPHTPKKLFTDSMGDLIPNEIINRKKMGFVLPWDLWMRNELKDFNQSKLNYLCNSGIFNKTAVNDLWKRFMNKDKRVSWSSIWSLVVLSSWIEENEISI